MVMEADAQKKTDAEDRVGALGTGDKTGDSKTGDKTSSGTDKNVKVNPQKIVNAETIRTLSEIRFIDDGGKPKIIFEARKITIPSDMVDVSRTNGVFEITSKNDGFVRLELNGFNDAKASASTKKASLRKDEDSSVSLRGGTIEYKLPDRPVTPKTKETAEVEKYIKLDIGLLDLRKEFHLELEGGEGAGKAGEVDATAYAELGFLEKIMLKFLRKTKPQEYKEPLESRLKKLSLENLSKVGQIENKKAAMIGVGYVLKQFLEIRFRIPHEMTYSELVNRLEDVEMKGETKKILMSFFMKIGNMAYIPENYALGLTDDNFPGIYDMAKQVITDLS